MSKNVLIISPQLLKARTTLPDNVEDKLLTPEIKAAQDLYILPLLGSALFDKLLAIIADGTIATAPDNAKYKKLVDDYLIDALCNYTLAEIPDVISLRMSNKGLQQPTTDNANAASMSQIWSIIDKYKTRAESYASRAKAYLIQNAPTLFPEYLNPGQGSDIVTPEADAFSCPIWLGDEEPDHRSFSEKYQGNRPRF